jgi:amino acid adenylation domain-containing protein/non-ribosomal peptide synthase protein (TIGR01720 family)
MQKEIIEGYRLSPQQKHLWLLQAGDGSSVYRIQCAIQIEGNLDLETLKLAVQDVSDRHEILRTTFKCLPGMNIPIQVINNSNIAWLPDYNLSGLNSQQQEVKIEKNFNQAFDLAFDLENGSLLYLSLVTLSPQNYLLIVSLPAAIADTVSLKNLVHEISRSYAACLQGKKLDDEPLQYADLAEWQNELLEREDTEVGREYWRKQNISPFLNLTLPLENQPNDSSKFQPHFLSFKINHDWVSKLKLQSDGTDANAFISTFLLTCWQVLLWRVTAQSDVVVATACNGRKYEELERAIGLLTKYLPLRLNWEENWRFREVLEQTHESLREIEKWQESFSWEQIVGSNEGTIEPSFFPFCFDFESVPAKEVSTDVCFSIYKQYACLDRFKVKLSCVRTEDSLDVQFYYDANLFSAEAIERLAGQFQTLLQSAIAQPEALISKLEILKPSDRQQLLVKFNNTECDYPQDKCIHHLFEEQAERTPDSIAVTFKNRQLTYAELNARANQLAHYLQSIGVKPEVLVGICVERAIELLIGILGILKAGGAYLPLDPAYPKERLSFMLSDAQVPVLLTQEKLMPALPEYQGRVFCLDTDWGVTLAESEENPVSGANPLNLAYVIYTSGSTGKPKGTMILHQGLVNYLSWCTKTYAVSEGCGAPVHSSIGFDATITSLFSPLLVGQKVILLPEEQEIEALSNILLQESNFSLVKITPAHLDVLSQLLPSNEAAGKTRAFIIGGEALLGNSLSFWRTHAPDTRLINEYGPTETVVGCCVYEVSNQTDLSGAVAIGRPIANTQIYILDRHLQPVPIGVPGELYIGGAGVARGYLNARELTEEKFIPNPFEQRKAEGKGHRTDGKSTPNSSLLPSASHLLPSLEKSKVSRLYKTGDLARYLPDGTIEFLGRIDDQVKIRGFRIELGEISAILTQHPGVRETASIVREDVAGDKRLVAYVVRDRKSPPDITELRQFLKQRLPEYMVPSAFVLLNELPLTPNGKIDRRALPAPDQARPDWAGKFVAPSTPAEKILAKIWAEVLRVERLGIHDNFFELGGDSILSLQIVAKANQAGFQLTPKHIFDCKSIANLAAVAGTTRTIESEQGLVTGLVPLIPIQHWFFAQNQPEPHYWNQAFILEMRQVQDPGLLEQVVQHLLEHHDALRLRFRREESGWQQVNASPDDVVPFTRVDLSALAENEQKLAIEATAAELQASLNLSEGSLLRVAFFDLGLQKASRLLIVIHHLVVDGVSWRILLEDFAHAYQQLSQGQAIHLPPKTTSFKQWAERLQEYAQSAELQQERDYWLAELQKPFSRLPVDYSGGDNTEASACSVSVSLSQNETQELLQQVPKAYNTQINDVLLTALVQAFAEWTGERTLMLELEGHGRENIFDDVDLSRTVGWFTTHFPVILTLGESSNPGETLKAIKEQLRSIPHRGIGYGVLRYLSRDLELQAQPRPEVSFNYLGQSDQVFSESSLLTPAPESTGASRSQRGSRVYLLEINGIVAGGQLQMNCTYSKAIHRKSTIENLAEKFMAALRRLITHCQSPEAVGYTPSDFPQMQFSSEELDELLAEL